MHPHPAFRPEPDADLLAMAESIGLAHIVVPAPGGPLIVHAPITRHGGSVRFHVARGNPAADHCDGADLVVAVLGVHGYISPSWYERPDNQVPTWNYVAVEMRGTATAISDDDTVEQLDRLALLHEPADRPWSRTKMDQHAFAKLLAGIRGFAIDKPILSATLKLSQNKTAADRAGVVAGLTRGGSSLMAQAVAAGAPISG
ncbi:FMN-binding negative transcriptional regulator [Sphingomonas sp. MA1305]|uniref:FMN-binding negative transcriptional regulator n=1 Tax=Sphingomonas sp. MA1305 TaxID=2479204 RepID=UPI0018DFECDF|nr:FMN-binding negative transcriptional regulator [Sphingomonas sp. MA1305]MBI0476858.1 FMN-binding negative transcriptional regulator [Sphingomonas sp. MA1305]